MKKLTFLFLLFCCSVNIHAANTLRIINDVPVSVADPTNIFIQLNYVTASIGPALEKFEVVYPFTDAADVYTLVITNIDSGNLKYGIDPVHEMEQYSKVSDPDVRMMFDGLFEFSLLATDTIGYWDISNVDMIGMLCSVKCTTGGYPNATWQLGYYKKSAELISLVTNEYQFTSEQADQVLIHSNAWSSSWTKLMAPNHEVDAYVDSPGGKTHLVDYLYRLESNSVPVCLKANVPSTDTGHFTGASPADWQDRVAALGTTPASFTGKFQWKSSVVVNPPIPGPGLTNEIVLVLSNQACGTVLYYSTDGINPATTYRSDSDGGLWVLYCTDTNAGTWEWVMTNSHLNCVSSENPSLFEDWVASLANKACYSLNAGLIPTNSNPINTYTFSGYDTLVPTETNTWEYPPYQVNMYNNIIVSNSDSYGMGYSDANPLGVRKVVNQTQKDGAIVELRLLDPDADPTPGSKAIWNDFDGDEKSDLTVYHEASGYWYIILSEDTSLSYQKFGETGYDPVPGDFDGDRKADPAVYHEASGYWYILLSDSSYSLSHMQFGAPGYTPVSGDFDADGKTDLAVYQESTGYWYIFKSSDYSTSYIQFGASGYTPVPGDYDGDGTTDLTVYQESTGSWYILLSGSSYSMSYMQFGASGYTPVSGDFDADGKIDLAVYQESTGYWYIYKSTDYSMSSMKFGASGYTPVPGDYDGDGTTDLTVYQESSGYWYILLSGSSYSLSFQKLGESGYTPIQ
ncbi:FG-GAP repeat domain-containing protein [Verrucomicrobiota bacterium]